MKRQSREPSLLAVAIPDWMVLVAQGSAAARDGTAVIERHPGRGKWITTERPKYTFLMNAVKFSTICHVVMVSLGVEFSFINGRFASVCCLLQENGAGGDVAGQKRTCV